MGFSGAGVFWLSLMETSCTVHSMLCVGSQHGCPQRRMARCRQAVCRTMWSSTLVTSTTSSNTIWVLNEGKTARRKFRGNDRL